MTPAPENGLAAAPTAVTPQVAPASSCAVRRRARLWLDERHGHDRRSAQDRRVPPGVADLFRREGGRLDFDLETPERLGARENSPGNRLFVPLGSQDNVTLLVHKASAQFSTATIS